MRKQYKEKGYECEKLEVEVVSLKKQQKMEKSNVDLDSLLEIHRSPLDKFDLGFQRGESSLHAGQNTKEEPKKTIENNNISKRTNQGNKK